MAKTETLIIGGGLAGLSLAEQLTRKGRDFLLLEARDRLGGRILTKHLGGGYFDLGPAWFWPGQPRISALLERLGLTPFAQHYQGDLIFEDERGQVQRGHGFASMQGSFRLSGGLSALISALADQIPKERFRLSSPVSALLQDVSCINVMQLDGVTLSANTVVLALPPRVAAQIAFTPSLPENALQAMDGIATWMAGQAKAVAIYERPFWREDGLSGDVMSRFGPMVEIHDASPAEGGPYALFGFIGVSPKARRNEQNLRKHLQAQLTRLFGQNAAEPMALYVKDWATNPYTATELDQQPVHAHPHYGMPHALNGIWDHSLIFGGTEVAPQFGGYLEGALEAAENALSLLDRVAA